MPEIEPGMSAYQKSVASGLPEYVFDEDEGEVTERDARGNPTVKVVAGETYYLPGSTPYESGHRTESERLSLDPSGQYLGVHEGKDIPEGTIILMEGDRPVKRLTREQAQTADLGGYIERDAIKYPVVSDKGKEILLTTKQVENIQAEPNQRKRFEIYREYGIVAPGARYITADEARAAERKLAAERFAFQSEVRRKSKALDSINKYRTGPNEYNVSQALADGVSESTLLAAGFTQDAISKSKPMARYIKATPKEKFQILKNENKIPPSARFIGIDRQGNIEYETGAMGPALPRVPGKSELFGMSDTVTSTTPLSAKELKEMQEFQEKAFWMSFGIVPVLGTALLVGNMAPARSIALSAATDLLAVSPVLEWLKNIKYVGKIPGLSKVEKLIKGSRAEERATLKAVTNKQVVKAYDAMLKAGDEYAANLSEINHARNMIKSRIGGALPEDLVTLEQAQVKTGNLKLKVVEAGNRFAETQKSFIAKSKIYKAAADSPELLEKMGSKYAAGVESVVKQVYEGKLGNITTLRRQLGIAKRELDAVLQKQAWGDAGKLTDRIIRLENEIKVVQSGQLARAITERAAVIDKIAALNNRLSRIKQASPKTVIDNIRLRRDKAAINAEIKKLKLKQVQLDKEARDAVKNLDTEWAAPIQRTTGGVAVITPSKVTETRFIGVGKPRSLFLGVSPKVGGAAKPKADAAAQEDVGRMTGAQIAERYGTQEYIEVKSRSITEDLIKQKAFPDIAPLEFQQVREMVKAGVREQVKAETKGLTKSEVKQEVKNAVESKVAAELKATPQAKVSPQAAAAIATAITTMIYTPAPPGPPMLLPHSRKQDAENRKAILSARGAIAWRQGRIGGKDRWDTIINPYADNSDYLMVLGKPPKGATIVSKGEGSAYRTAQITKGKGPAKTVRVDSGFQDIIIKPRGRKRIAIAFIPDPKMETTGDITIGQRKIAITERPPRLSSRRFRITPVRPRIGR